MKKAAVFRYSLHLLKPITPKSYIRLFYISLTALTFLFGSACQNKSFFHGAENLSGLELLESKTQISAQPDIILSTYTGTILERPSETTNLQTTTVNKEPALNNLSELQNSTFEQKSEIETELPTVSVWDKMRNDFAWVHYNDNERIDHEILRYSKNTNYLPTIASRAQYFLHFIVNELNRRNMPVELALLPVVESAFNPYAISSSQAVGLWQFIRGTGDIYKLTRNEWLDQRRNCVDSTIAAVDYLESLLKQFDGNIELALAAYNAGPTTVRKAQNANIQRGLPSDYWSLKLPRETMDYVPRLIAVAKVINAPYQYKIELPEISYEPYFQSIEYTGPVSLTQIAETYNLDYEHLHFLNAQYTYKVTPPGQQPIILPIEKIAQAQVDSSIASQFTDYTHITSNKPMTLTDLSIKKRTPLPILSSLNPSYAADDTITAGTPVHFPDLSPANEKLAKLIKFSEPLQTRYHVVRKGDTLWNISRRYNVNHKDLARWNKLSTSSILSIGKKLKIKKQTLKPIKKHYVVAQGDTLWSVAKRFDVSISDLRQWNNLQDHNLSIGQKLTMVVYK